MNKTFIFKVMGVFFLTILMSWAVSYINSIIIERQANQESAKVRVANGLSGKQTITGPLLIVPYYEEYPVTTGYGKNAQTEIMREESTTYMLPENLELSGGFTNEFKKSGIYKVLMYQLGGQIKGNFRLPPHFKVSPRHEGGKITFQAAYLSMGISDTRGINGKPELLWGKTPYKFIQGSRVNAFGNGIHAPLGEINPEIEQVIPFEFKLNLRGTEQFGFTPIADNNVVALQSSWQHPQFGGSFLPDPATQKVTPGGFSANWAVSSLSSSNQARLTNSMLDKPNDGMLESLNIGFIEPINVYSLSDRATKYGLLFIGLTFAGFFIFELMKQLRIHPAQYTMVGLAMAMFYLLLISLSEHVSFGASYFAASFACVSLLGYYLSHALKSKINGAIFATLLTALYGALYGILQSEDNALLMGSLLVFGLLALTMVITRKVDWYQISNKPTQNPAYAGYTA